MKTYIYYYNSPVGFLQLQSTEDHVISINFSEKNEPEKTYSAILKKCILQLDEYFEGKRKTFNLPLLQSGTVFQSKVWHQLNQIPFGKTISYLDLALQIGDAKAVRAVAAANGRNNCAIVIPCHRVIGSNKTLTGYAGGLWRKQWLLQHEAKFHSGVQQFDF